jgi:hypothetical protein
MLLAVQDAGGNARPALRKNFESGSYDAEESSVGSVIVKVVPFPSSD